MPPFLSESSRAALERVRALDAAAAGEPNPEVDGDTGVPLARLAAIRTLIAELESDGATLAAVRAAEQAGADWTAIAEASGLRPAAARWRWQGTDDEIAARHEAGRKRGVRPSSVPTELPGLSVAEAARELGVTVQAVYLQIKRGRLRAETVTIEDGRSYRRVFPDAPRPADDRPSSGSGPV